LKLPWKQHIIEMYGKEIPAPRLYQWMGIAPTIYGERIEPIGWTPEAREIQQLVYRQTGFLFDSLNINYYRNGEDHIGWHIDGEDEGMWEYPIASVSFGAVRNFQVQRYILGGLSGRKRVGCSKAETIPLAHGSLVVMPAMSQREYQHKLKKATKAQGDGERINLTFRMLQNLHGNNWIERGVSGYTDTIGPECPCGVCVSARIGDDYALVALEK